MNDILINIWACVWLLSTAVAMRGETESFACWQAKQVAVVRKKNDMHHVWKTLITTSSAALFDDVPLRVSRPLNVCVFARMVVQTIEQRVA